MMFSFLIYSLIASTLQTYTEGSSKKDSFVVGGEAADIGEFPYMVSLKSFGMHTCGGSILSKRTILTAGHCTSGTQLMMTVNVGLTYLHDRQGQVLLVENTLVHPNFTSDGHTATYDVAVLHLAEDIKFNDNVQPIELDPNYIEGGDEVIISGWGLTKYPGLESHILQYVELKTTSQSKCNARFGSVDLITRTHLCTFTKKGEGICMGDSGGPLVKNGKQVGVASWVEPCAAGFPDVFARISEVNNWIQSVII